MSTPLSTLNACTEAAFVDALGPIVENAPWVAAQVARSRPYDDLGSVLARFRSVIGESDAEAQRTLLLGHPELAGHAARSGAMEPSSVAEQRGAGLLDLAAERTRLFDELNAAYRSRFGFPFVVAVRRHGRDSILRQLRRRLENPPEAERGVALAEVLRIVALRLDAAVAAPDRLPVVGRLSTHVLDTAGGVPAEGVAVELFELVEDAPARMVARARTNAGGRTDAPLIGDAPVPIATYELRFALGDYYRARVAALADPPFLDVVPIRFAVAEPEAHYHVPLAATPWSYATYRGS